MKKLPVSVKSEADLGMFSMFGRTGASTKRAPPQKDNFFLHFLQHGNKPEIVDDDYCACRPRQCRVNAVGGGVFILGAPTFFSEQGPHLE